MSAAREVLNAQGTGPLPPAEPHEESRLTKSGFAKPWIANAAVLLVGGAVGVGYALRPAIEPPQTIADSKPAQTAIPAAAAQEAPVLSPAVGPSTVKRHCRSGRARNQSPDYLESRHRDFSSAEGDRGIG